MSNIVELTNEDLRTLQLLELEMLCEVDRICRKNGIEYSIYYGSLIGAVRHKGFIPWDDDVDVAFTRENYEKFYEACKTELDDTRFFFQDHRTDPQYRWGYGKLRRKNTEYIKAGQEKMKYKTGVCIDLFPFDNMPDAGWKRKWTYFEHYCIRKITYSELGKDKAPTAFLRWWYSMLYRIPLDTVYAVLDRIDAKNNRKPTELVCLMMLHTNNPLVKYGVPAEFFSEYVDLDFEGMKIRAVKQWDRALKLAYGDYMKLPPVEQQKGVYDAVKVTLTDITMDEIRARYGKN